MRGSTAGNVRPIRKSVETKPRNSATAPSTRKSNRRGPGETSCAPCFLVLICRSCLTFELSGRRVRTRSAVESDSRHSSLLGGTVPALSHGTLSKLPTPRERPTKALACPLQRKLDYLGCRVGRLPAINHQTTIGRTNHQIGPTTAARIGPEAGPKYSSDAGKSEIRAALYPSSRPA
jgi:hypothetical protein